MNATHSPAAPARPSTGRIILRAPEITPHPLSARQPFVVTPQRFTLEMVQVDLAAPVPAAAVDLLRDPVAAAGLLHGPLLHCIRELDAARHRDAASAADFRRMAAAVSIDHRGMRGMRPVTLLFCPDSWQDVERIAGHFRVDPQAVLRAALRIALDRKLAATIPAAGIIASVEQRLREARETPGITATRAGLPTP